MSWGRSKAVEVYLGETLVGCRGLDDAGERWATVASVDAGVAQLHEWTSAAASTVRARVWLGSTLARPLVLASDCGARNREEARALASMTAGDVTGQDSDLKVWTARWRSSRPTLAVAMSRAVLLALETPPPGSQRKRLRIDSVRPWWNQVFDAVRDRSRAQSRRIGWTLVEPDGLIQGRVDRGEVVEAAFEGAKAHDADWTLLRRRLAIGWDGIDETEHFAFGTSETRASSAPLFAIGSAAALVSSEVAA